MPAHRGFLRAFMAICAAAVFSSAIAAQGPRPARVVIEVRTPADALVTIDGIPISQTGPLRKLLTPELPAGQMYEYTLKAVFTQNGRPFEVVKTVIVEVGKTAEIDLNPAVKPKADDVSKAVATTTGAGTPRTEKIKPIIVPYVATPDHIVKAMLKLAGVTKDDTVYDLGSGDGRIPIAAVKDFSARRGLGIDIDSRLVAESKSNARRQGVENRVAFFEGDVLRMDDLAGATVVTLYMLPQLNRQLVPLFKKALKPGARIVSHDFDLGTDWKADRTETVLDSEGNRHTLYLWSIPDKK